MALSQPFSPASGDGVCPGSDIEFTCVGNSEILSNIRWMIIPDGAEPPCFVPHNLPDEMQSCGPGEVFTSFLTGQTGLNYTSSLRAEDVPLSLNGTLVECVNGEDLQTIGSANICIVSKRCVYIIIPSSLRLLLLLVHMQQKPLSSVVYSGSLQIMHPCRYYHTVLPCPVSIAFSSYTTLPLMS